jgi:outer membrane protein TolC
MSQILKTLAGFCVAAALWSQTEEIRVAAPPATRAVQESPSGRLTLQEALESTLSRHPQARIGEQQVAASRGVLREASGIFDPVYASGLQQSFAPTPLTTAQQDPGGGGPNSAALNLTSFNASASRLYRNGITGGPVVELDRARDRLLNAGGINQSRLAYQITIPLLRNKGAEVVAAQEISAGVQVQASQLDLNQTFTDLLTNTAVGYWDLVGAMRMLEVAIGSEQRGQMLVENVDALVRAERIPRNDTNEVRANLDDRIAGRIAAEQQVVVARQQLALAMGLPPESMASLADPAEDFPEGIGATANDPEAIRRYIDLALSQRSDYLAARKRVDAARTLLALAKNGLRPIFDLTFSAGYSGLREGVYPPSYLASLFHGVRGPDAMAGLRYEFAPRNNAAAGRMAQTEVSIRQAELRAADTARGITAAVVVALAGVRNAGLRLEKAREAVTAFQSALDGEREKYRLGFGSLVNILTIEDRLTATLAVEVQARLDAAVELAHLRQATGTLVEPNAAAPRADGRAFVTLPVTFPVPGGQIQP